MLFALTWARPLWLDELLTLLTNREATLAARLATIHQAPGAVPLGYEVPRLLIQWLGFSVFTARFPSEVFSVLALGGMLLAAREIGTRGLVFVGVTWAVLPLLLRYAVEGRPYALALLLSVASTILLFRLMRDPRLRWAALYLLTLAAGLYTQPYTVFLQAGLAAPLLFQRDARRAFWLAAASLAGAALLFAPWLLTSAHNWTTYALAMEETFTLQPRLPLMLLREISGGGYVCSLSLLAFVAAGCLSRNVGNLVKRQLFAGAAGCVLLALVCDVAFGYFFAIRQVISALVPLGLLAGEGWAEVRERWGPSPRWVLLAALVASSVVKDTRHFRDRSENWELGAQRLERASRTGCILYLRGDLPGFYEFFEPALETRACGPAPHTHTVAVPITRYSIPEEVRRLPDVLAAQGYHAAAVAGAGETIEIRTYSRAAPVQP